MANGKRLIDANEPLKQLSDYMEKLHCSDDYRDGLYRGMEIAESYIKNAPTVEAEPVVHGRWITHNKGQNNWCECSECNTVGSPFWKRCPVCEAKMDGGNEDV